MMTVDHSQYGEDHILLQILGFQAGAGFTEGFKFLISLISVRSLIFQSLRKCRRVTCYCVMAGSFVKSYLEDGGATHIIFSLEKIPCCNVA